MFERLKFYCINESAKNKLFENIVILIYSPTVLNMHQRDDKNVLASDRCLLNTGTFQCICFLWEMNTCLLNKGCLLNTGGHNDRFY